MQLVRKVNFALILSLFLSFWMSSSYAQKQRASWSAIEKNYQRAGGDLKALSHVKCFLSQYSNQILNFKSPSANMYDERCYNIPSGLYEQPRYFTIIDYIKPGYKRRLFLVDTLTAKVKAMGVAHGRYQSGYMRLRLRKNKNSLKWARYFSNTPGSNAPSSGFYFAGQEYEGKFGRSLVLHGLEEGVNDNACERAVVIHKHAMVSKRRAYVMSSGCPMVSWSNIDPLIDALKGDQEGLRLTKPGGLVFIYGPREREWGTNQCPLSKI